MSPIERICTIHDYYQLPGGEDTVFQTEGALLERHGVQVERFTMHNTELDRMSTLRRIAVTVWNENARRALRQTLANSGAQVAHFHNTFPLISPAGYAAAVDVGIPIVQTLHNYRIICPNALLFRDGAPCEECVGRTVAVPGILHACYRGDRKASAVVAGATALHRLRGTWSRTVTVYIAMTEFARDKFIEGGLPANRIVVKPNFVDDPGAKTGVGDYALFVGRLSMEKGIDVLASAWRRIGQEIPLTVVGDGPLSGRLRDVPGVTCLGHRERSEVTRLMHQARVLIFPSVCYEGCPLAVLEALACGLPVVASGLGAAASIVTDGTSGWHFSPADPESLARTVRSIWTDLSGLRRASEAARAEYLLRYSPEANYRQLMAIYERALAG